MWIFPSFILMSAVATKLPHYILPVWPALGLLAAIAIEETEKPEPDPELVLWMQRGAWLFGIIGGVLTIALLAAPWFLPIEGLMQGALPAGLVTGIMTVACLKEHRARRYMRGAILLFCGMLLVQVILAVAILPAIESIKISPAIAEVVRTKTPPGTPVSTFRYMEPSLVYYLDRGVVGSLADEAAVAAWAGEKGPGVLILPRSALVGIGKFYGALPLVEIGSKNGLNIGKVGKAEIVVLKRQGGQVSR